MRHDPVDAVAEALFLASFDIELHALVYQSFNELIALGSDDRLRIVVQFFFAIYDVVFDVLYYFGIDVKLRNDLFVPFEDLDGVPAYGVLGDDPLDGFLDMRQGVLDGTAEDVRSFAHLAFFGVAEHG